MAPFDGIALFKDTRFCTKPGSSMDIPLFSNALKFTKKDRKPVNHSLPVFFCSVFQGLVKIQGHLQDLALPPEGQGQLIPYVEAPAYPQDLLTGRNRFAVRFQDIVPLLYPSPVRRRTRRHCLDLQALHAAAQIRWQTQQLYP